jgi:DNA-binding NarL/FixJ family response regulator
MQCYWEEIGVLGPIYGLIGKSLSERDIARNLNLPEATVNACTSWLMHFLKCDNRAELVLYAATTRHETWGLHSLSIAA